MNGKAGLWDSVVEEKLDRIEEIRARYDLETIQPHLEACRDLLQERDIIDVGVFGRFKAGKSSFLNSLGGRGVLPVGVTPVTAVITRIRYGPKEKATVEFLDGRTSQVPTDSISSYIAESQTSFDSIRSELVALGREYAGQTRPWIMRRMAELQPDIERRITGELVTRLSGLRANLWKTSRAFEEWLSESMTRHLTNVSQGEASLFCVPLDRAQGAFSRAVQGFRDRLAGNIYKALSMEFSPEPFEVDVRKPGAPPVSIGNLFMFNIDLLWFVIPMALFRTSIERRLLRRVPLELEKNLSRVASQWTDAINASIGRIEKQAIASVRGQIATVESVLSRTQSDAEEIRSAIGDLTIA